MSRAWAEVGGLRGGAWLALLSLSCGGAPEPEPDIIDISDLSASEDEVEAIAADAADQMQCPREDLALEETTLVSWSVTGCDKSMHYDNECEPDTDHCAWYPRDLTSPDVLCVEPTEALTDDERALAETEGESVEVDPGEACQMEVPVEQIRQESPQAPPETAAVENHGEPPREGHLWATGYYYWTGTRYVWVTGYWVPPSPGYAYVSGTWKQEGDVWVFTPGGWAVTGTTLIVRPAPARAAALVWVHPVPRIWVARAGARIVVRPRATIVRTRRALVRRPIYRHRRSFSASRRSTARRRTRNRGLFRRRR